ncbi:aldehyde dehydrogenase, dimeric NADP-preferring-like [Asbolus verrucosus]|uniref:Aldehyde dehydrogenase n=1 Tax=Asbolus verrucosus TaxID=1661398 RepID=A0A482VW70_ASBVE|nr:aldehyde dehydrogenase, dimeric NADP-preferring-like [Asbolus verrucosus]
MNGAGSAVDTVIDLTQRDSTKVVQAARSSYDEGKTRPIKFRKKQLNGIIRPERPPKPIVNLMDDVLIYNDPYGVVLVMGAWNYPLQLTLAPVIGAIAAGNCVVIKPSDLSPATSQLIYDTLPKYLDHSCYPVYLGGVKETTELLKEKFDYIFYTGSTAVGRIIHQAANKNLTPVTLEMGGKSPAYIDSSADIAKTVRRIMWGKCTNSGQTCIAPDYILCTKQVQEQFVQYAQKVILEFYGQDVKESPDMGRIITERHFERLVGLLSGLQIAVGGCYEKKNRFIEPTIAVDVNPHHPIMQEEIFGPILPIIPIEDINDVIEFINQRDKPLALYIFTKNKATQDLLLRNTSSGGVCINDTLLHVAVDSLPFGGVGNSGMGAYHGKKTFDTFTHKKSVLVKDFGALPEKLLASRYPPYSDFKISFITMGMKERKGVSLQCASHIIIFLLGVAITIAVYYLYKAMYD